MRITTDQIDRSYDYPDQIRTPEDMLLYGIAKGFRADAPSFATLLAVTLDAGDGALLTSGGPIEAGVDVEINVGPVAGREMPIRWRGAMTIRPGDPRTVAFAKSVGTHLAREMREARIEAGHGVSYSETTPFTREQCDAIARRLPPGGIFGTQPPG